MQCRYNAGVRNYWKKIILDFCFCSRRVEEKRPPTPMTTLILLILLLTLIILIILLLIIILIIIWRQSVPKSAAGGLSLPQIQWQVGAFMISLVAGWRGSLSTTPCTNTQAHTHKYKNSKVSKYTYMKNDRRKSKILWYQEHIEIHCTFGFWYLISSSLYCICNRKHWRGDIGIWACASPRLGIWHRPDQDNRDTCSKSNINEQRLNQFRAYDCMNVSLASDDIKTFNFHTTPANTHKDMVNLKIPTSWLPQERIHNARKIDLRPFSIIFHQHFLKVVGVSQKSVTFICQKNSAREYPPKR